MMEKRPGVGVGVFILKDGKVLMGKRRNAHGDGTWSLPGGHLEFGEDVFTTAHREVLEETGLEITNLRLGPYTNDIFEKEGKHYITLFVISDHAGGEPQVLEPDKCERWEWADWEHPPEPFFLPIVNLRKTDFSPWSVK